MIYMIVAVQIGEIKLDLNRTKTLLLPNQEYTNIIVCLRRQAMSIKRKSKSRRWLHLAKKRK